MPEFTLPGRPDMVTIARRTVRILLDGYPCIDDAELVVSEGFTNSVRHSKSGEADGVVLVKVDAKPGLVRVEITDDGKPHGITAAPTKRELDEYGRGLIIVDTLTCGRWGQETGNGYGLVWAELEYEA